MQFLIRRLLTLAMLLVPLLHSVHAAPFLYASTYDESNRVTVLSVIDTATGTRTGQIMVRNAGGAYGLQGVAFSPAGNRIYAATGTAVSVINVADNQVIAEVPVDDIVNILINPAGTLLYVITKAQTQVINTATNTVVGTSSLLGAYQVGVFDPAGKTLYRVKDSAAGTLPDTMEAVDVETGSILASVAVGFGDNSLGVNVAAGTRVRASRDMAVNSAGTRVYVLNTYSAFASEFNSVSVYDVAASTVIATIPVGSLPVRLAVNQAGTRVYVSNLFTEDGDSFKSEAQVTVIDTASNTVSGKIGLGTGGALFLAINPAGTRLYVNIAQETSETSLAVIDTGCNTPLSTLQKSVAGGQYQELYFAPALAAPPGGPAAATHVQITGIEVTQGIQDLDNSVPLVTNRRTFVRVHVKSDGPVVNGVTAILSGIGNIFCKPLQCPPVGETLTPLVPVNTVGTRIAVGPTPKRYNLDDSFLFELPYKWTQFATLHLHAVVTEAAGLVPTQSCTSDILSGPSFKFGGETLVLKVQFVRLSYRFPGTFNGVTNAYLETSLNEQRQSESFIRRLYPLAELQWTPDYQLFDDSLGAAVKRESPACDALGADDKNLCAHHYITARLAQLQASTGFMGNADAIYGLIPQVPNDSAGSYFTRGACCTSRVGAGPSTANDYAAHELGHFLGRQHPVPGSEVCGHSASDPDYPYFRSWIAPPFADVATSLAGFDGGDPSLAIPMNVFPTIIFGPGTVGHYDEMGYCKPAWISDYTYKHLRSCLAVLNDTTADQSGCGPAGDARGPGTAQQGDWLTVSGHISPAPAADFLVRHVERNYSPPRSVSGSHSIRLVGSGGVTLAEYPFTPDDVPDAAAAGGGAVPRSFGLVVPFVAGTQSIEIVDSTGPGVIGQKTVSANAPVVSNVMLQGPPDPATGLVSIAWNASDADGDSLTYDVFFTRDLGATLHPLRLGVAEKSVQIDTTGLGGGSVQLRVLASDGVHSGFADTPPFALSNKPPLPRILNPGDGVTIHAGQLINLEGTAADLQDGAIPDSALTWSVAGQTLGSGPRLSITDLPVGINAITLTATNSLGVSATSTAHVTVKESVDQPGPTLKVGPRQIGWQIGADETGPQSAELTVGNVGSGSLQFTAQSSAPWLTLSVDSGAAPATITITADPAGAAPGTMRVATITVTAAGSPAQSINIPVTLAVGNTFVTGKIETDVAAPPAPDFAITAAAAADTVTSGQSAQTVLTVNPSNGFHDNVTLSCTGLPASATCSFSPASLAVNGAAATTTLTIATATYTAMNLPAAPPAIAAGGLAIAACGAGLGIRRRRRFVGARCSRLLALLVLGAAALHGCSGGGSQPSSPIGPSGPTGTPAGTYTVTITATSGSISHSVAYALTVN